MPETSSDDLIAHRGMSPNDFHDHIPRIREVAEEELVVPADLTERLAGAASHLLVEPSLLEACAAALIVGHIVLQGPPGTGKSSLARAITGAFGVDLMAVTAHEDWSTFEVIGRQELRLEHNVEAIVPLDGHVTEAVIRCAGNIPLHQDDATRSQATWLLIDELNRANPDKAFGELFSVLGTDDIVDVVLVHQPVSNNPLVVPRRFRIIATINSIDKQFVNSLSQGLRRRFTFLTVDVPAKRAANEPWGTTVAGASAAAREFTVARDQAIARAARRTGRDAGNLATFFQQVTASVAALFDLVERVRYADEQSPQPFIPIGTAPIIDTLELFLVRSVSHGLDVARAGADLDWAVSARLIPLFDAGMVNRDKLQVLADGLVLPFTDATRRAMAEIAADGLYYVG